MISTSTETDVAVSESDTVMASDTVVRSGMVRWGDLVCVNCPVEVEVALSPSALPGDKVKSDAVTPVTSSLKVAL